MKKLINTAFIYAILAMAGGVFYREFTKFNGAVGTRTTLAFVHTHLFMLGMCFFLLVALFADRYPIAEDRKFKPFYITYNAGLAIAVASFIGRGITQTLGLEISKGLDASISGIAGIGHIILCTGMILFFVILKKHAVEKTGSPIK